MQRYRMSMVAAVAGLLCAGAGTLQAQRVVANVTIDGIGVLKASSISFGVSNSGASRVGGGGGIGKASMTDLKITRDAGQYSGAIFQHVAAGTHLRRVTVEMLSPAGTTITLGDVVITSDHYATNSAGQTEETVALDYAKIEFDTKGEGKLGWDVKANAKAAGSP
ncbi:MAG: type VI secretion system tube protein Hcp [Gemmatimonadota bacterium]|nr:type VI secretion system tube protein Hcp [Gemmatimonadota bacterium]